jgi:hypothetical protein
MVCVALFLWTWPIRKPMAAALEDGNGVPEPQPKQL